MSLQETTWSHFKVWCFLPLDAFFLPSFFLVFFMQVGPIGLVANAVALSSNVGGVLDHQTIVYSKSTVLHVLEKPPEWRFLLLWCHDSLMTWEEEQRKSVHSVCSCWQCRSCLNGAGPLVRSKVNHHSECKPKILSITHEFHLKTG